MNNKIAIILGIVIVGCILLDTLFNGGASLVFLGKKFAELIEWIAFWR